MHTVKIAERSHRLTVPHSARVPMSGWRCPKSTVDERALVSEQPARTAWCALTGAASRSAQAEPHPEGLWTFAHQRHTSKLAIL